MKDANIDGNSKQILIVDTFICYEPFGIAHKLLIATLINYSTIFRVCTYTQSYMVPKDTEKTNATKLNQCLFIDFFSKNFFYILCTMHNWLMFMLISQP